MFLTNYCFKPSQFNLFQAVADLIAVAVANILANEEIKLLNKKLQLENTYLLEEVTSDYNFDEFVGQSKSMIEVFQHISLVAKTDTTVLILGETGTGKELVARAIHNSSNRKGKALIKLNCAALPANLIESELFGHERGAFTGAIDRRIGKFEIADGSTLFLDEIGELPLELQAKLLRAIQEKEFERLGSNKVIKTDARIIAATNRNLQKEVKDGKFRSDLYYRLNVFPIELPPLRARKEDITPLVNHLLKKIGKKTGKVITAISNKAMEQMSSYQWPGNIREMEHILERAVLLSKKKILEDIYLPDVLQQNSVRSIKEYEIKSHEEQERDYILFVLEKCKWKIHGLAGAAAVLQLPPTTPMPLT
jgi:formate hydrogenlyase transcriptional activator